MVSSRNYSAVRSLFFPLSLLAVLAVMPMELARGQVREEEVVRRSSQVLNEIMSVPAQAIPERMLSGAQGIAIIPNVIKGGFVIGARYGRGVLVVRDDKGSWHAPIFITLTGGSLGWQAGVQSTDVVLVFKTKQSINSMLSRKFTLGVDASVAAGPVGRQASAATDAQLKAEIYSYARSRGLFLGAALDGSMIEVDPMANGMYYRSPAPGQPAIVPPSAVQLVQQVAAYCNGAVAPVQPVAGAAAPAQIQQQAPLVQLEPTLAQQHAVSGPDALREQLSETAPEMLKQLDPQWASYLALPAEVFVPHGHPSAEAINNSLKRYEAVASDPRYQALYTQPAFQSTYGLLRHYASTLRSSQTIPQLPPPPQVP